MLRPPPLAVWQSCQPIDFDSMLCHTTDQQASTSVLCNQVEAASGYAPAGSCEAWLAYTAYITPDIPKHMCWATGSTAEVCRSRVDNKLNGCVIPLMASLLHVGAG